MALNSNKGLNISIIFGSLVEPVMRIQKQIKAILTGCLKSQEYIFSYDIKMYFRIQESKVKLKELKKILMGGFLLKMMMK